MAWNDKDVVSAILQDTGGRLPTYKELTEARASGGFWWRIALQLKRPLKYHSVISKAALSLYKEFYARRYSTGESRWDVFKLKIDKEIEHRRLAPDNSGGEDGADERQTPEGTGQGTSNNDGDESEPESDGCR